MSKHIDVHCNFIKILTKEGKIDPEYHITEDQEADMMTKPLKVEAFMKLWFMMGVGSIS